MFIDLLINLVVGIVMFLIYKHKNITMMGLSIVNTKFHKNEMDKCLLIFIFTFVKQIILFTNLIEFNLIVRVGLFVWI